MPAQSSMHFYFNWAKERIDEMDAVLASLEAKAGEVQAESRSKADLLIADLHKKRDEFQEVAKKQADAGEAAWLRTKSQLEGTWNDFEIEVKKYVWKTFGKQVQQTTFQNAAAAQLKAWRDAAEKIHNAAAGLAVDRRSDIDATLTRMKADASKAEAKLQETQACRNEISGCLERRIGEIARGFGSGQSVGLGCAQARRHSLVGGAIQLGSV